MPNKYQECKPPFNQAGHPTRFPDYHQEFPRVARISPRSAGKYTKGDETYLEFINVSGAAEGERIGDRGADRDEDYP